MITFRIFGAGRWAISMLFTVLLFSFSTLQAEPQKASGFQVSYDKPADATASHARDLFVLSGIAPRLQAMLEREFKLKQPIALRLSNGSSDELYYDEETGEIFISYAFLPFYVKVLQTDYFKIPYEQAMRAAVVITELALYNELSYALLEQGDVLVKGQGRDEAFALTLLTLREAAHCPIGDCFQNFTNVVKLGRKTIASGEQRDNYFYKRNMFPKPPFDGICTIIGMAPGRYSNLAAAVDFDDARIKECERAAKASENSLIKQLQPLFKPGGNLSKL